MSNSVKAWLNANGFLSLGLTYAERYGKDGATRVLLSQDLPATTPDGTRLTFGNVRKALVESPVSAIRIGDTVKVTPSPEHAHRFPRIGMTGTVTRLFACGMIARVEFCEDDRADIGTVALTVIDPSSL